MPISVRQLAEITKEEKVQYVKSQGQTRDHHCHWPGCNASVPPALWGCYKHWMMLPKHLRDKVWAAYRPGQEVNMTPSVEYLEVAEEVQKWIKENYWSHTIVRVPQCLACEDTGINSKGNPCVPCQKRKGSQTPISLGYLFDD